MQDTVVKILIVDDDEDDFIITGDYIKHIPEYYLPNRMVPQV